MHRLSEDDYVDGVLRGDRTVLARAITLAESSRPDDQHLARNVLDRVVTRSGSSIRVGISGVPGVGKSTLIDRLGCLLDDAGHRVAVLAVDPSSQVSGGSILGDKTRMEGLSHRANAFVRPSPTSGTLGGVARKTREAMLLCEAAGFDVVLVETVGVGQSEATVAEMVDLFVLLLLPGGGDELQGIKRGILERADLIVINKADGPLKPVAERTRRDYAAALHTLPGTRSGRQVMTVSATEGHGVEDIWTAVGAMRDERLASGDWQRQRDAQRLRWLWSAIEDGIHDALHRDPALREAVERAERDVSSGRVAPTRAADAVLARLLGRAPG